MKSVYKPGGHFELDLPDIYYKVNSARGPRVNAPTSTAHRMWNMAPQGAPTPTHTKAFPPKTSPHQPSPFNHTLVGWQTCENDDNLVKLITGDDGTRRRRRRRWRKRKHLHTASVDQQLVLRYRQIYASEILLKKENKTVDNGLRKTLRLGLDLQPALFEPAHLWVLNRAQGD